MKLNVKHGHDDKSWKMCGIEYKDCECCLNIQTVRII